MLCIDLSRPHRGGTITYAISIVRVVLLGALLCSLRITPGGAQQTIIVGTPGPAVTLVHAFISKEAGLFQKHGLDARIVVFEGGSLLAQAALAGEVKISMNSGSVTIASRSQGADSTIVGAYVNTLPYSVVAAKGLTKWEQLKGKRIAISRFGSATDTAVRLVLARFGLDAGKDVTLVQAGSQPTRFQALVGGSIEATIISPPFDVTAQKQGYPILANIAELGIPYPQEIIETTDAFIRENPQVVKSFLKSFAEGIHYAVTRKEDTKKIMAKYLKIRDPEILESTYQSYLQATDRKLYPNVDGMRTALDEVAKRVPAAKNRKPEEFINTRFLDELDKEGFLKQLYK
jgi:NitT/TauT family transport system substrate-binding protein